MIKFGNYKREFGFLGRIAAITVILVSSIMFGSCEKYLDIDKYVYDQTTLDSIFLSRSRTEEYINGAAALLPDESILMNGWGWSSTLPSGLGSDEAIVPFVTNGNAILYDEVKETNTWFNPWGDCYKGIRKANIVLENISKNQELTEMEMRDFKGRAYFLRAYFYFYLVRLYGPVVVLPDRPFDTDEDVASVSFERSTYDECVEKICADFEEAAKLLPPSRIDALQYIPTKGAALAFKARMQLYAASPLFNGNSYYSDWKDSEGRNFIAQTEDKVKWGKAAATFKRIIDMNKYAIHTVPKIVNEKGTGTLPLPETVSDANFPDGAGGIDPYKSYKTLFDGTYQPELVKEYIYFSKNNGNYILVTPSKLGGISSFSVTLDMIDEYRMADGRPFSEATQAEKSWQAVGQDKTFSSDYLLSGNRAHRDDGREPRFYATIGFNACIWPTTYHRDGLSAGTRNYVTDYYYGGSASDMNNNDNRTRTGYTCRKYVHQDDCIFWNGVVKAKTYPIFRYAEVLLGYVEAMNEMEGSYTDEDGQVTVTRDVDQMVKYFNQIRYRAGQPGITTADAADQSRMRELIKHERLIEFAFESHRYWDLRRWKDAYDAYNKPIRGLDVSARESQREQFYTERIWNTEKTMKRMFSNKMYLWPLDRNVLRKNGKLVQNPGWN